ncbi:nucleotidyltransferase [Jeotgalibacillus alimentarius]|uniref:Nucleotidyltransferase n=1 Tax=Jeotgalibacillus alimentarius TaxID=135826 RepID=A0A0C2VHG3_9BACL|nr:nucleotidyltransferase substrate binding protein [Jeotgalibacillus alimentarius]KIL43428.1 nucleotidyltransferase [Jeotgalibacillus alimentarius]
MERLYHRLKSAEKALDSFEQLALLKQMTDIERDAAIQRFEFSFEAAWKAAKQFFMTLKELTPHHQKES